MMIVANWPQLPVFLHHVVTRLAGPQRSTWPGSRGPAESTLTEQFGRDLPLAGLEIGQAQRLAVAAGARGQGAV